MKRLRVTRAVSEHEAENRSYPEVSVGLPTGRPSLTSSPKPAWTSDSGVERVRGPLAKLQGRPHKIQSTDISESRGPMRQPTRSTAQIADVSARGDAAKRPGVVDDAQIDTSIFECEAAAMAANARLFKRRTVPSQNAAADALATTLASLSGAGAQGCVRSVLLARALELACAGDAERAMAAIDCWRGGNRSKESVRDAFAAARLLARSDLGFDALYAATEPSSKPSRDADAMISYEARRQALQLVDTLIVRIEMNSRRGRIELTEARAIELANELVEAVERGARLVPAGEPPVAEDLLVIARALACARTLSRDAGANPPSAWRAAYFAARCGCLDDGAGGDFQRIQESLEKFVHDAQHAVVEPLHGPKRFGHWLKRVFSSGQRAPLSPLHGEAQIDGLLPQLATYDPEHAIVPVIDHLKQLLVQDRAHDRAPAVVARRAIRVAALKYWLVRVEASGKNVAVTIDARARKEIGEAAEVLLGNSPAGRYVRGHTRLSQLQAIGPEQLCQWAAEEGFAQAGALAEQTAIMEWTVRMAHPRSVKTHDPGGRRAPQSAVRSLAHVAAKLSEGTTAVFSDGSVHGPTSYVKLTSRVSLFHGHLPPQLQPTVAVSGEVLAAKGRHALVELNRVDAHEMTLAIVEGSDDSVAVGAGAFLQIEPTLSEEYLAGQLDIVPSWRRRRGVMFRMTDTMGSVDENMQRVVDALASACAVTGSSGAPAIWESVAQKLYKDPGISIGWMSAGAWGAAGEARLNATGRAIPLANALPVLRGKGGWMGEIGASAGVMFSNGRERNEQASSSDHGLERAANLFARQTPAAALPDIELPQTLPAVGPRFEATSFSSARLASHRPFDRLASDKTWSVHDSLHTRVVTSHERIDVRRSVREAEATDMEAFLRSIDGLRAAGGRDGIPSRKEIAEAMRGQSAGIATYVCKQRMLPTVVQQIDALHALSVTIAPNAAALRDPARTKVLKSIERRIEMLRKQNSSWTFDSLAVRSTPQTWGQSVGPRWLFRAQTQTFFSLSHERTIDGQH